MDALLADAENPRRFALRLNLTVGNQTEQPDFLCGPSGQLRSMPSSRTIRLTSCRSTPNSSAASACERTRRSVTKRNSLARILSALIAEEASAKEGATLNRFLSATDAILMTPAAELTLFGHSAQGSRRGCDGRGIPCWATINPLSRFRPVERRTVAPASEWRRASPQARPSIH
jgi:hypothetical protein